MAPSSNKPIVFQTPSKYDSATFLLLAIAPVSLLAGVIVSVKDADAETRKKTITLLGSVFLSLSVLIALVLPSRFEVVSDRSINVVNLLQTNWNFCRAQEARPNQGSLWEKMRGKYTFSTCLCNENYNVVVLRDGRFDLLVSPMDPEGFMRAINNNKDLETQPDASVLS